MSLPAKGIIFSIGTDQRSKDDVLIFSFLLQADIALHENLDLEFEGNFSNEGLKIEESFSISFRAHFRPVQEGFRNQYIYCKFRIFFLRMN